MSKTVCYIHTVFSTKNREMTLSPARARSLYQFIWSVLEKHKCTLVRINSMPDHVHILFILNPKVSLSDLMRIVKAESSGFINKEGIFPMFGGWGKGYYAASVSYSNREDVIEYIKNQQIHHVGVDFANELQRLYKEIGQEMYPDELS